MYSSIIPVSLENLFNIRPEGFLLKNLMQAVTTFENTKLCRYIDACKQKTKKYIDWARDIIIAATVNPV